MALLEQMRVVLEHAPVASSADLIVAEDIKSFTEDELKTLALCGSPVLFLRGHSATVCVDDMLHPESHLDSHGTVDIQCMHTASSHSSVRKQSSNKRVVSRLLLSTRRSRPLDTQSCIPYDSEEERGRLYAT